jgi:hypothetical protein
MLPTDAQADWPYINKPPQYGTMDDLSTADLLQLEKLILNTLKRNTNRGPQYGEFSVAGLYTWLNECRDILQKRKQKNSYNILKSMVSPLDKNYE